MSYLEERKEERKKKQKEEEREKREKREEREEEKEQKKKRELPQSIEAEQALLGLLISDAKGSIYEIFEIFGENAEVFSAEVHRLIFQACLSLNQSNKPIDIVTLTERLDTQGNLEAIGGREYLSDLAAAAPIWDNPEEYAEILQEKSTLRNLIKVGRQISDLGYQKEGYSVEEIVDQAQETVFKLSDKTQKSGLRPIVEITNPAYNEIARRYETKDTNPLLGISTGFKDLDTVTLGLQSPDLIIVAARPSMGKTAFCLNIAEKIGIQEKQLVAIFSLEMSQLQILNRLLSINSGVDAQRIRTGHLEEQDFDLINTSLEKFNEAKVFIDDSASVTVMDIRAKLRRLKAKYKELGLVIIDYIQLMKGSSRKGDLGNRVQEVSAISRDLKILAREFEVPIIALSQLSRSVESRNNKRPMLSDLRESGSIEQDADIVSFLYRHEYYEPDDPEQRGVCEVIISKQRNGPTGTISLSFNGANMKFTDL